MATVVQYSPTKVATESSSTTSYEHEQMINLPKSYDEKRRVLKPYSGAFNFMVFATGTALVATPYSFSLTTPYWGVAIEFFLVFFGFCSVMCIFNATAITGATSFTDLGRKVFGTDLLGQILTFVLVTVPVVAALVGALTAYILISATIVVIYTPIPLDTFKIIFTAIVALCGLIKSFQQSRYISYVGFVMFVAVAVINCVVSITLFDQFDIPLRDFNFTHLIQAIPVMSMGFYAHMPVPGIASEMSPKSQRQFPYYFLAGLISIACINSVAGLAPSLLFGYQVGSDSLEMVAIVWHNMYGYFNTAILIAQLLLATILIIQSPLFLIPAKEFILDRNGKTVQDRSLLTNFLTAAIFAFVSGFIAIIIPNITNSLNTFTTVAGFILGGPTAAYMSWKTEKTTFARFRAIISLISGLAFLGFNSYTIWYTYNVPEEEQYPRTSS